MLMLLFGLCVQLIANETGCRDILLHFCFNSSSKSSWASALSAPFVLAWCYFMVFRCGQARVKVGCCAASKPIYCCVRPLLERARSPPLDLIMLYGLELRCDFTNIIESGVWLDQGFLPGGEFSSCLHLYATLIDDLVGILWHLVMKDLRIVKL